MYKYTLMICLVVLAVNAGGLNAGRTSGSRSSGQRNYKGHGGMYGAGQAPVPTQTPPQTPKEYLDNKSGFSTFGIISIIFVIIVFCLVFYYGIMCYPILCGEEKKYRFMDVSSTITSAMQSTSTSRSIQSINILHMEQ